MVPEILSATDKIFCHYGSLFALLPPSGRRKLKFSKIRKTLQDIIILEMFTINGSHMIHMVFQIWNANDKFFVILDRFLPFYPPNDPKNPNFEKLKKEHQEISSF